MAQTTTPDRVIVVDNEASERSSPVPGIVAGYQQGVHYIPTAANLGYGAGLAIGMEYLHATIDPTYYWLLDDDSPPGPATLATKVAVIAGATAPSVLSQNKGAMFDSAASVMTFGS